MRISGSIVTDMALGAVRDVKSDDYDITMDSDIVTSVDLVQPHLASASSSNETVQTSFIKANHGLVLAPATGQTITDFVTLVAGLWEIEVYIHAWFDWTFAVGGAKAFALGILPTDTGQTTQICGIFALIGTQNREFVTRLLLRKGATLRAVLGPTAAAQNIAVSLSMVGHRIL